MQLSEIDIEEIKSIRHIIESGIFLRIRIKELLPLTRLGESKLTNGFKFLYQITISHYYLHISMEYAKALLEDGAQVKQVAIKLGYKTARHFSWAFMQVFHQPPSSFKRNNNAVE